MNRRTYSIRMYGGPHHDLHDEVFKVRGIYLTKLKDAIVHAIQMLKGESRGEAGRYYTMVIIAHYVRPGTGGLERDHFPIREITRDFGPPPKWKPIYKPSRTFWFKDRVLEDLKRVCNGRRLIPATVKDADGRVLIEQALVACPGCYSCQDTNPGSQSREYRRALDTELWTCLATSVIEAEDLKLISLMDQHVREQELR